MTDPITSRAHPSSKTALLTFNARPGQIGGQRVVAVNNRIIYSPAFKTFHDFLFEYLATALGKPWGNEEQKKPLEERHPVMQLHQKVYDFQRRNYVAGDGKVVSAPANGAMSSYLFLAYDLYQLDHNAEVQERLLARLRHPEKYSGARYEAFVAAVLSALDLKSSLRMTAIAQQPTSNSQRDTSEPVNYFP